MDSVLRLQEFGPQVSDGHLLLLKRGEVLLGVWGSDAMVVPTQVVGSKAWSSAEQRNESGKLGFLLFFFFFLQVTNQKHFEMQKSKPVILVKPALLLNTGMN